MAFWLKSITKGKEPIASWGAKIALAGCYLFFFSSFNRKQCERAKLGYRMLHHDPQSTVHIFYPHTYTHTHIDKISWWHGGSYSLTGI